MRRPVSRHRVLDSVGFDFRAVYPNWERVAREVVHTLRVSVGNEPHNPRIAQLVGELTMRCSEFTGRWSDQ
jgi:transcription regulator MmyB-like protein